MSEGLPERLRALRTLLESCGVGDSAALDRAVERLDRDLLPRTAGGHSHLVVGIVGPNNAGKSALFNGLVGASLSPSMPTGGATRHLLGVAHPSLAEKLEQEPTLAQFPLRRIEASADGVREVLSAEGDPAELFLVAVPELPPGVLLIDTPDFDSILEDNRRASESLLKVCDLAVVVVTRHTYQNREVVSFLEGWLAHGRPWTLVYNESLGSEVTREHAEKLAADLAVPPSAVFQADFELGVQRGERALRARALANGVPEGTPLGDWLFDLGACEELKERALASSLGQLRGEIGELATTFAREGELARDALSAAQKRGRRLGREVAGQAMPMAPFLEAFRAVLDRRPSLMQRGLRGVLRRTRLLVESGLARLPFLQRRVATDPGRSDLAQIERAALEPAWPAFFEELTLELRPGGGFWTGHAEGAEPDPALAHALVTDLAAGAADAARERTLATLGQDAEVLRVFQEACEERIEAELAERGSEWFFQLAVDAVHVLPAVAAGIAIVKTGGLGFDFAVGGAGALSSLLAERVSKLLGTDVARSARERWTALRGERLGDVLVAAALEQTAPLLEERAAGRNELARALETHAEELTWQEPAATT